MPENYPAGNEPIGFETLTVEDVVIALAAVPAGVKRAEIFVEGDDVRYRVDGTDPTVTVGALLLDQSTVTLYGALTLKNFRAIENNALTTVLSVHYYG